MRRESVAVVGVPDGRPVKVSVPVGAAPTPEEDTWTVIVAA